MDRAIKETERRRKIQIEHNKKYGIIPQTIKKPIENNLLQLVASYRTIEDIVADGIQMTDLFKRLNELMPQALEIGRMRQLGMSDTAISAEIGIPRKTFTDRLKRAKDILKSEFPDIF